jgi:RimJ/RimL family protein N-acetyltransferase
MIPRKLMYENDRDKLIEHFLVDIIEHDRYLRFGYTASDENVEKYVNESLEDYGHYDMWFVVEDNNQFVGTVHVALQPLSKNGIDRGYSAEMGFTVSPDYRERGLGQQLFDRGATWAMMKGAKTLYTQCLSENMVMQHIAKKNGMTVITIGQGEKEATVKATKGVSQAYYDDKVFDSLAFVDMAIQKQQHLVKTFLRL